MRSNQVGRDIGHQSRFRQLVFGARELPHCAHVGEHYQPLPIQPNESSFLKMSESARNNLPYGAQSTGDLRSRQGHLKRAAISNANSPLLSNRQEVLREPLLDIPEGQRFDQLRVMPYFMREQPGDVPKYLRMLAAKLVYIAFAKTEYLRVRIRDHGAVKFSPIENRHCRQRCACVLCR